MNWKKKKKYPSSEKMKVEKYISFEKKEHLQYAAGERLSFFFWFKSFETFLMS